MFPLMDANEMTGVRQATLFGPSRYLDTTPIRASPGMTVFPRAARGVSPGTRGSAFNKASSQSRKHPKSLIDATSDPSGAVIGSRHTPGTLPRPLHLTGMLWRVASAVIDSASCPYDAISHCLRADHTHSIARNWQSRCKP